MKAIVQSRYGGADCLSLAEIPPPVPDDTSVLLQVRAASVNALDWRIMTGSPFLGRLLFFGLMRPKRPVRGVDVAGDIIQIRKPDSRFHVGDAVFGLGSGSFAEQVAADESEITTKPPGVSYVQGATLGVAACTALQAVRDVGAVESGQRVLVLAGASGVGTFAIQLAKWKGAHVTAVTRASNVELLRAIGADRVVPYESEDVTREAATYDCIIDISGRYSLRACRRRLTESGKLVVVGARGGIGRIIIAGIYGKLTGGKVRNFIAKVKPEDLRLLGDLVVEGKLQPVIAREYPLKDAPAALEEASRHLARGKLVITT